MLSQHRSKKGIKGVCARAVSHCGSPAPIESVTTTEIDMLNTMAMGHQGIRQVRKKRADHALQKEEVTAHIV
jgi:hypothetical protein